MRLWWEWSSTNVAGQLYLLKDGTVKALVIVTFSYGGRMPAWEDSGQYITRVTSSLFWVRWVEACLQRSVTLSLDCLVVTFSAVPSYLKSMKWKSWRAHIWVVMVCGQKSCFHFDFSLNLFLNGLVLGLMGRVCSVSRKFRYFILLQLLSVPMISWQVVLGGLYQYIASANLCIEFALFEQMDFIFSALDPSCLVLPFFCHYCTYMAIHEKIPCSCKSLLCYWYE